jgi:choline-sulfatase
VACEGDPDQLYDLAEDPAELVNLAAEPGHRPILTALRATLAARWDLGALRTHVMASQLERHLVGRALEEGAYTSWDFEPSVDASTRYVRSRADLYALQRRSRLEAPTVAETERDWA